MTHKTKKNHIKQDVEKMVLLINLGTPSAPTVMGVGKFLAEFLSDKKVVDLSRWIWLPLLYGIILPFRSWSSARKYQRIWTKGGSPLFYHSQRLSRKLCDYFGEGNVSIQLAMRYGSPTLKEALRQIERAPPKELVVIPLYPQYAVSTVGSIVDKVSNMLRKIRLAPSLRFIQGYAAHDAYIEALAVSINNFWSDKGRGEKLLISYHGIPKKSVQKGDPYQEQCEVTTKKLVETLGLSERAYAHVYQSRFGPAAWLSPYCKEEIIALANQGIKKIDVVCPGFPVDCLETLDEVQFEYAKVFCQYGGESLRYIPALNESALHVECLAEIIQGEA
jgi:ferrochelatase